MLICFTSVNVSRWLVESVDDFWWSRCLVLKLAHVDFLVLIWILGEWLLSSSNVSGECNFLYFKFMLGFHWTCLLSTRAVMGSKFWTWVLDRCYPPRTRGPNRWIGATRLGLEDSIVWHHSPAEYIIPEIHVQLLLFKSKSYSKLTIPVYEMGRIQNGNK